MNSIANLMDTINKLNDTSSRLNIKIFAIALFISLIAALFATILYRVFYENRGTGSQVYRSFPLLGISITSLFVCIQLSLPLSLGLLGALSIIRFRTPIKEPEEVGFIMLVIASSVSSATLNFRFLVILNITAFVCLLFLRWSNTWRSFSKDGVIILNSDDPSIINNLTKITGYINQNTKTSTLESSISKNGVASIQFSFTGLKTDIAKFQEGINSLGKFSAINIFFNKPGGIR